MLEFLVLAFARIPWDSTGLQCPEICCRVFSATCLACNHCITVDEYCQREPRTFGCAEKRLHTLHDTPAQANKFNGTLQFDVDAKDLKVNLSDAGFSMGGVLNPFVSVRCTSTDDCEMEIEIFQAQENKTCVLAFEDIASNFTSDEVDFKFEDDRGVLVKLDRTARTSMQAARHSKIAQRLTNVSFLRELPPEGATREKAERVADFLDKAREGRKALKRGQAAVKLVQTRRVKQSKRDTLLRMSASCFEDALTEDTDDDDRFKRVFMVFNKTNAQNVLKFDTGGFGYAPIQESPDKPSMPFGGWGEELYSQTFPIFHGMHDRSLFGHQSGHPSPPGPAQLGNGEGGVVPSDAPAPQPPSTSPRAPPLTPPNTPPSTPPSTPPGTPPSSLPRIPPSTPPLPHSPVPWLPPPSTPPDRPSPPHSPPPPSSPPSLPPSAPPSAPPNAPPGAPPSQPPSIPPPTPPLAPPATPPSFPPLSPPSVPPSVPPPTPPPILPGAPPSTPPSIPPFMPPMQLPPHTPSSSACPPSPLTPNTLTDNWPTTPPPPPQGLNQVAIATLVLSGVVAFLLVGVLLYIQAFLMRTQTPESTPLLTTLRTGDPPLVALPPAY